jgi:dTDP-4-dehydrorhamnose reductase
MNILLTGANGFIGRYLTASLKKEPYTIIATGKQENKSDQVIYEQMDFTHSAEVEKIFENYPPSFVIHAGAMSNVDECEINKEKAFLANITGTEILLKLSAEYKAHFILLSTDFVFDGERGMYLETDKAKPVNYYGETKLRAEELVRRYQYSWTIIRTCLVYGDPRGTKDNILTTVKKKLSAGENYSVVDDQLRTPTYVEDLTDGIVSVVEKKAEGIFHISGNELMSPWQMALATADFLKLDSSLLKRVTVKNFSQAARRPLKTGFVIEKAMQELGYRPVSFEEGLRKTFSKD